MSNNDSIYAVYGNSGFGREIMPILMQSLVKDREPRTVFLDDNNVQPQVNGYEVWTFDKFIAQPAQEKKIAIAIADSKVRETLARKCSAENIAFMSIEAKNHVRMDDCTVGAGAIFCPFTTLTSNISIGSHFHCNIYSYIAHDCVIGNYVTFAPGVKCNGNIRIEDHAYIGTGAILKQGTPDNPLVIGAGAIIGMGAVVTKNVAPGAVVVGNPARPMIK